LFTRGAIGFGKTFLIKSFLFFSCFKQRRGIGQSEEEKSLTCSVGHYMIQKLERKNGNIDG